MRRETLQEILEARRKERSVALVTSLESYEQRLIDPDAEAVSGVDPDLLMAVRGALRRDRSVAVQTSSGRYFAQVFNPPLRMLIVGAVHIAQALAPMALLTGYAVTVIDPRNAFATDARFAGVELRHDWPDEALLELAPDRRTAVITLTHDPKLDDPALGVALRSSAFYLGSLGSRRTQAQRLARLREAGFSDRELERIHGPVGLSLGAQSPAEIAVSILAEVTQVLHAARTTDAELRRG